MRSDLAAIPGVSNIQTSTEDRTASFEFSEDSIDIEAKLAELGETNEHMAGWSMM